MKRLVDYSNVVIKSSNPKEETMTFNSWENISVKKKSDED